MLGWSVRLRDLCSVLRNDVFEHCLMEWIIEVHSGLLAEMQPFQFSFDWAKSSNTQ